MSRPHQALGDSRFAREKCRRDFRRTESAQRAERKRSLRIGSKFRMKADEHHPQRVVLESFVPHVIGWRGHPPGVFCCDALLSFVPASLALQRVEGEIFCHLRPPRCRIVWHPAIRPRLQRTQQRFLHRILGELQPVRAEVSGKRGDRFRAYVTEKVVGELKTIEAGFSRPITATEWRVKKDLAGGGPLMDVGIYALQTCRFVSGRQPLEVNAKFGLITEPVKFSEVEESVEWEMTFPDGLITTCRTNYERNGVKGFTVTAEKGNFGLDPAYNYKSSRGTRSDGQSIDLPAVNQFAAEMDDFAQCIMTNKPSKVSGEEGLRDVKIMMPIYQSTRTGKTVKLATV